MKQEVTTEIKYYQPSFSNIYPFGFVTIFLDAFFAIISFTSPYWIRSVSAFNNEFTSLGLWTVSNIIVKIKTIIYSLLNFKGLFFSI